MFPTLEESNASPIMTGSLHFANKPNPIKNQKSAICRHENLNCHATLAENYTVDHLQYSCTEAEVNEVGISVSRFLNSLCIPGVVPKSDSWCFGVVFMSNIFACIGTYLYTTWLTKWVKYKIKKERKKWAVSQVSLWLCVIPALFGALKYVYRTEVLCFFLFLLPSLSNLSWKQHF